MARSADGTIYQYTADGVTVFHTDGTVGFIAQDGEEYED